jgi:hypothetical protein
MIDNDLKDKCSIDYVNKSIEQSIDKVDDYLRKFSSSDQKKNLAKVRMKKFCVKEKKFDFL